MVRFPNESEDRKVTRKKEKPFTAEQLFDAVIKVCTLIVEIVRLFL